MDLELRMSHEGQAIVVGRESHSVTFQVAASCYLFRSRLQLSDGAGHVESMRGQFEATFDDVFALVSGDYQFTSGDETLSVAIERDAAGLVVSTNDGRRRIEEDSVPIVPSYVLAQLPVLLEQRSAESFDCVLFAEGELSASSAVQLRRVPDLAVLSPPAGVSGAVAAWQQLTADGTTLVTTYLAADGSLLANDYGGAWAVLA